MIRVLLGAFIVAHGLLTAFIWVSPANADAPFRATHSWLIGDARALAWSSPWWSLTGIGAGAVALLFMGLCFNPWLPAGIAISAASVGTAAVAPSHRATGGERRAADQQHDRTPGIATRCS